MLKLQYMKSAQNTETASILGNILPDWWKPIDEQPISELQKELETLVQLSALEIPLRDDQILREQELKKFFAERIENIHNN
jgi:hypothetical protein